MTLALGYRSVDQMLHSLSGRELTRWRVYERVHGPLDDSWRDEMLASMVEMIQYNAYITGAVGQAKKNPAQKPKPVTRPNEIYEKAKEQRVIEYEGGELVLEQGEVNPFKG